MSCDWDIICVDCNAKHGFRDMSHAEDLTLALISHADAIVQIHALTLNNDVELVAKYPECRIDPTFFKAHQGHRLRPIDEYGRLSGDCFAHVACPSCGASHRCKLPAGHEAKGEPHR